MAAPMERVLSFGCKRSIFSVLATHTRNMGFISNLRQRISRGSQRTEELEVIKVSEPLEVIEEDIRKKRKCIEEVRPYSPPSDFELEEKIQENVDLIFGPTEDWKKIQLSNPLQKYELLTSLIGEFDHDIPNSELNAISNIEDVIKYYKTEVRDTSAYTDMASLNLPKNLHINLEPIRFDKETDTIYGGKTAFPKMKTIVSSVKYRRKYKGTDDNSHPIRDRPIGLARWKD